MKHSWIKSIQENTTDRNLSANKQNLKNIAANNNYYLFDATTKTMSIASNHENLINENNEEWEWEEDEDIVSFFFVYNMFCLFKICFVCIQIVLQ